MSDELLEKIMERLDQIEARLDPQPEPVEAEEVWPDWNEDPESLIPVAEVEQPKLHKPAIPRFETTAVPGGFVPRTDGVEWEPGAAKLPISDQPIAAETSSGHSILMGDRGVNQLDRLWQREMLQAMRVRPVEDRIPD